MYMCIYYYVCMYILCMCTDALQLRVIESYKHHLGERFRELTADMKARRFERRLPAVGVNASSSAFSEALKVVPEQACDVLLLDPHPAPVVVEYFPSEGSVEDAAKSPLSSPAAGQQ